MSTSRHVCGGASRDTWEGCVSNWRALEAVRAECDGKHALAPWGGGGDGGTFSGVGEDEGGQPQLLCETVANLLIAAVGEHWPAEEPACLLSGAVGIRLEQRATSEAASSGWGSAAGGRRTRAFSPHTRRRSILKNSQGCPELEGGTFLKTVLVFRRQTTPAGSKVLERITPSDGVLGLWRMGSQWDPARFFGSVSRSTPHFRCQFWQVAKGHEYVEEAREAAISQLIRTRLGCSVANEL